MDFNVGVYKVGIFAINHIHPRPIKVLGMIMIVEII